MRLYCATLAFRRHLRIERGGLKEEGRELLLRWRIEAVRRDGDDDDDGAGSEASVFPSVLSAVAASAVLLCNW